MIEITIPVLNEEKNIKRQILLLHAWLSENLNSEPDWTIIIADNGSNDSTQQYSRELETYYKNIKYIRIDQKGVGKALHQSWSQSSAEIIGYMDLDFATKLEHIKDVVTVLENGYDLIYGTRLHPHSVVQGRSLQREISSRCFNFIIKHYLKTRFSDGMCGFKFLKKNIYQDLYQHGATNTGWFFSTELLAVAERKKYKIYELPIHWTDTTESHVKIIPLAWQYIHEMIALKSTLSKIQVP